MCFSLWKGKQSYWRWGICICHIFLIRIKSQIRNKNGLKYIGCLYWVYWFRIRNLVKILVYKTCLELFWFYFYRRQVKIHHIIISCLFIIRITTLHIGNNNASITIPWHCPNILRVILVILRIRMTNMFSYVKWVNNV